MQATALLLHWGSYRWARNLWVLIIYLFPPCYVALCASKARHRLSSESVSWCLETSLFLRLPSWDGAPSLPLLSFCLLYFFYLLSKTMGCFSGCLMSSVGIQKLFCGIYSGCKCSFNEFVGEKVVSPSYSSTILGPPPSILLFRSIFMGLGIASCFYAPWGWLNLRICKYFLMSLEMFTIFSPKIIFSPIVSLILFETPAPH